MTRVLKKIAEIIKSEIINKRGFLETYFHINDFPVQALSYENNPVRQFDFDSEVELVKKAGKKIPCMSLKSELKVYQALNRASDKETVEIIKKELNKERIKNEKF
jgi:hypothetical protein